MNRSINLDTADASDLAAILPSIDLPADGVLVHDPTAGTLRVCSKLTMYDTERVITTHDGAYAWMDTYEPTDVDWLMLAESILAEDLDD